MEVASFKTTSGAILSSGSEESVEIGRSGSSSIVRIASTYASLRLESVRGSQNFTGFTISRNSISGYVFSQLGTVPHFQIYYTGTQFNTSTKIMQGLFFGNHGAKTTYK